MVSSVEMVLWAIHHATTLLFGVFASAASFSPARSIRSSCTCRLPSTYARATA